MLKELKAKICPIHPENSKILCNFGAYDFGFIDEDF
jgi:hypothetical protein